MKKITLLVQLIVAVSCCSFSQNIGIGTTTPNSSAMLDVQSNNKGLLVARIALTAANSASPVTSPADALLIYNRATAGTGTNAVVSGFYYWKATALALVRVIPLLAQVFRRITCDIQYKPVFDRE